MESKKCLACDSLNALMSKNLLFAYPDYELTFCGLLLRTNDGIEEGVNAQMRAMPRNYKGMSAMWRVKALLMVLHVHGALPIGIGDHEEDADRRGCRLA